MNKLVAICPLIGVVIGVLSGQIVSPIGVFASFVFALVACGALAVLLKTLDPQ